MGYELEAQAGPVHAATTAYLLPATASPSALPHHNPKGPANCPATPTMKTVLASRSIEIPDGGTFLPVPWPSSELENRRSAASRTEQQKCQRRALPRVAAARAGNGVLAGPGQGPGPGPGCRCPPPSQPSTFDAFATPLLTSLPPPLPSPLCPPPPSPSRC
jgi:hypothetical protein